MKKIGLHLTLRMMGPEDWEEVSSIYKEGIDTRNATFEREVPVYTDWDKAHLKRCRIVAVIRNRIAGWATLSKISNRSVYSGVAEVSVYVSDQYRGQSVGTRLLEMLISESEKEGFWTLQAGIFPENTASLRLHKKLGFREVGFREKIGMMDGVWRDTILLERRSKFLI